MISKWMVLGPEASILATEWNTGKKVREEVEIPTTSLLGTNENM